MVVISCIVGIALNKFLTMRIFVQSVASDRDWPPGIAGHVVRNHFPRQRSA